MIQPNRLYYIFTSAVDFWLALANTNLKTIHDTQFGANKIYRYGHAWFLRSIILTLYDPSFDIEGFSLGPGDFHS